VVSVSEWRPDTVAKKVTDGLRGNRPQAVETLVVSAG
jgi:hypothetical protein